MVTRIVPVSRNLSRFQFHPGPFRRCQIGHAGLSCPRPLTTARRVSCQPSVASCRDTQNIKPKASAVGRLAQDRHSLLITRCVLPSSQHIARGLHHLFATAPLRYCPSSACTKSCRLPRRWKRSVGSKSGAYAFYLSSTGVTQADDRIFKMATVEPQSPFRCVFTCAPDWL
jgi:hypothetical protein